MQDLSWLARRCADVFLAIALSAALSIGLAAGAQAQTNSWVTVEETDPTDPETHSTQSDPDKIEFSFPVPAGYSGKRRKLVVQVAGPFFATTRDAIVELETGSQVIELGQVGNGNPANCRTQSRSIEFADDQELADALVNGAFQIRVDLRVNGNRSYGGTSITPGEFTPICGESFEQFIGTRWVTIDRLFRDPFTELNGGDLVTIAVKASFQVFDEEDASEEDSDESSSASVEDAIRQQVTVAATRGALITEHAPDVHRRIARLKGEGSRPMGARDNDPDTGQAMNFLGGHVLGGQPSNSQSSGRQNLGRNPSSSSPVEVSINDDRMSYSSDAHRLGAVTLWSEGAIVRLNDGSDQEHRFKIAHTGAEVQFGSRTLVGLGLQLDNLDYTDASTGDTFDGSGWMLGPYIHSRLRDNLFVDLRLAFGKVNTDVDRAAATRDEYQSNRALAQLHVIGDFTLGGLLFAPTAELHYYQERSKVYRSSVYGDVPETTVRLFHGVLGGRVSRTIDIPDGTVSPYIEASAVFHRLLSGEDGVLTYSYADAMDGWSARFGTGLRATLSGNTTITLGTEYTDGDAGAWAWGGHGNVAIKF